MSRTYRIRSLPRLTAKKYVDGRGGHNWRRENDRIDKMLEERFPEIYVRKNLGNWGLRYMLREAVERSEMPARVRPTYDHPWVSWSRIGSVKVWYKRRGNRNARRRTRHQLRTMPLDDEFDDRRKFPRSRSDIWDIWNIC